jgi:nucleoside transport protein
MSILISLVGLIVILGLAFLMSNDKKNINFKAVGIMVGLQFISTWLLLGTNIGLKVLDIIATGFNKMISYGMEGVNFVVGGWYDVENAPFFITVLLVIVFTSTVLAVLTHLRILPLAIKYIGGVLSKLTGLPKVESFNAVNSIFFGQSEAVLAIKDHLPRLNKNRLFIVCTSAMASVSASIVGSYMTMLPPRYVLVALVLNMFSALIIASIVAPIKKTKNDTDIDINDMVKTKNVFEAISQGALDGGKVALIVSAMLIAYLGILALINGIMNGIVGFDLNTILSYVFAPFAFIMGVPAGETLQVGQVMGTKILANEFVAIMQVQPMLETLSLKTQSIISTFLISFGAFGSIGIIAGSVQAINGAKAKEVSAFGLKMLVVATMASMVSATIAGMFV